MFQTNERVARRIFPAFLISVLLIAYIVDRTGGIKFVFSHSMYLPILLAGFIYGVQGGILIAVLGGLALGPYMPIDSVTGEMQETLNWVYRTVFFCLVGVLSGVASDSVRAHVRKLEWDSRHDPKSGLRNRAALLSDLRDPESWKLQAVPNVLAVVTIDNMADLRTAFGIDVIEEIVTQLARRSVSARSVAVEVYRSSPEQLAFTATIGVEDTPQFLDELSRLFQLPFQMGEVAVHADARIGYVRIDAALHAEPETLLLEAEAAALAAHRGGQQNLPYHASLMLAVKDNVSLLGDLQRAMNDGELAMHYQPKVEMRTGQVCGVEALIRWKHPQRGWIPPGVFIPRAEQSTLIQSIVEFSLVRSLEQVTRWREKGMYLPVAVNVSPRNLVHAGFVDRVLALLDHHEVKGEALELEITEGALMTDMDRMIDELNRLAQQGVRISVDDFGTGFSSLQYLHRLPIAHVKIDQSFVQRALVDDGAAHIVESAISLAHKMRIKAIAEGIENEAVYALLESRECDIAQGYAICRPLPEMELTRWYVLHRNGFTFG
jgi:EAL domain-containing protein (putative c-di-GMP-specific phosphodiesterase class I)